MARKIFATVVVAVLVLGWLSFVEQRLKNNKLAQELRESREEVEKLNRDRDSDALWAWKEAAKFWDNSANKVRPAEVACRELPLALTNIEGYRTYPTLMQEAYISSCVNNYFRYH